MANKKQTKMNIPVLTGAFTAFVQKVGISVGVKKAPVATKKRKPARKAKKSS